jgi:hypothetical protein
MSVTLQGTLFSKAVHTFWSNVSNQTDIDKIEDAILLQMLNQTISLTNLETGLSLQKGKLLYENSVKPVQHRIPI